MEIKLKEKNKQTFNELSTSLTITLNIHVTNCSSE